MALARAVPGIELLSSSWPKHLRGARCGLVVHPASVDRVLRLTHKILIKNKQLKLSALFGPQHGIWGQTQDNMIEWEGFRDKETDLPVYSLYGAARKPTPGMLKGLDAMIVDLQDVGSRYYTFIWTLCLVMEACSEQSREVLILDRPNPVGGILIEGPVLEPEYSSFVGLKPLPVRHGMTIGEIGHYLRDRYYPSLSLHVKKMKGWRRSRLFDETGLPWVMPSPNMPTLDTALVYPGMCLLEGTNLSEGRGTTRPFEIFGAPFADPEKLTKRLAEFRLPGVVFRPLHFLPTFQKHANMLCGGAQIHISDRERFRPFRTAAAILKAMRELWPRKFAWKKPPYEYEKKKMPIDILAGSDEFRKGIDHGMPLSQMAEKWADDCRNFDRLHRKKHLLYR